MFYEVFIPSNGDEGFDVTITVEAENWMTALKSGLERTGQGAESIRNVMCDIKDDNSIHVTDASTQRVFVLREVGGNGEADAKPVNGNGEADAKPVNGARAAAAQTPDAADESRPGDVATKKLKPLPNAQRQTAPPPEAAAPPRGTTRSGTASVSPETAATTPGKSELRQSVSHPPPAGTAPPPGSGPNAPTQKFEPVRKSGPPARKEPPTSEPSNDEKPAAEPSASPELAPEPAATRQTAGSKPSPPSVGVQSSLPPEQATISEPEIEEPEHDEGGLAEHSWTSEDKRMRIGSSTFEALQRDEPEPKVVRETRAPSGQREAVDIGRAKEAVSQNVLEEVFLEIQQIHEQGMTMEQVINFVMDLSMEKIGSEAGSIMFADVNGRELYFATARGPKAHEVMDFRVPMSKGIVGFCAREGVSLAISDAENDPRFYRKISEALGYATRSVCCAPIQFEGRVYGAIELMNKSGAFTNTEVNVLTYIGRQLAKFVHDLIMSREKLEG